MKMPLISVAILAIINLTACGGGGGSSGSTSTDSEPTGSETGQFLDSAVANLAYETSSGVTGSTGQDGSFEFNPGDSVTFKLYGATLPAIVAQGVVKPSSYSYSAANSDIALNIARLLQTLDSDGNPDNGLELPSVDSSAAQGLDFDQPASDFEADPALSSVLSEVAAGATLVSEVDAQEHMDTVLFQTLTGGASKDWRVFRFDEDGGASLGEITFTATGALSGSTSQTYAYYTLAKAAGLSGPDSNSFSVGSGKITAYMPQGDHNRGDTIALSQQELSVLYQGNDSRDSSVEHDVIILGSTANNLYWLDTNTGSSVSPQSFWNFTASNQDSWYSASDDTFDPTAYAAERELDLMDFNGNCNSLLQPDFCGYVQDGSDQDDWRHVDLNTEFTAKGVSGRTLESESGAPAVGVQIVEEGIDYKDYNHHAVAGASDDLKLIYKAIYETSDCCADNFGEGLELWASENEIIENIRDALDSLWKVTIDDFNRGSLGADYVVSGDGCSIVADRLQCVSTGGSSGRAGYVTSSLSASQRVSADLSIDGGDYNGAGAGAHLILLAHSSDLGSAQDYFACGIQGGQLRLVQVENGAAQVLSTGSLGNIANNGSEFSLTFTIEGFDATCEISGSANEVISGTSIYNGSTAYTGMQAGWYDGSVNAEKSFAFWDNFKFERRE